MKRDDRGGGLAEASGPRLYFEISGRGEPVIPVHAGIADHRMWDPQVAALASAYQVLNYDMRGFGRSGMAGGPYSHHGDLRDLLDHLAIERARLVGCSNGGRTVIDPESTPPAQLDELVVRIWVDGPYRSPDRVDPAIRNLVREMNLVALRNQATGLGEVIQSETSAAQRLGEFRATALALVGKMDRPEIIAAAVIPLSAFRLPGRSRSPAQHTCPTWSDRHCSTVSFWTRDRTRRRANRRPGGPARPGARRRCV